MDGRYRIERELGRGGMATVYLAEDAKHGRRVAVKVLRPEVAAEIGAERFRREIEVVARLSHPHIVPLHDSGVMTDGRLYYVMPWVEGETLRDRLRREPRLAVEEAVRVVREVAGALDYAHRAGLVHRDVKPENILFSDGMALVTDFGIARAAGAAAGSAAPPGATRTTVGAVIGTPAYMAPEQIAGGAVDGRTDLYALACVLHETLAGSPPFTGPPEALFHQHLAVVPRPITELHPGVPAGLATALTRALAKSPADRHATAAAFADALAAALPSGATVAPTAVHDARPRPRTRFIGREGELEDIPRFLAETRLVTLTGIGGGGKTRLALEASARMAGDFPQGSWFVDLAALREPGRVAETIASALGVTETAGRDLLDLLRARVREGRHLLVLDNCEHVLDAAAAVVDALLDAGAGVRVLATSREALGLAGERLLPVGPLGLPRPGGNADAAAAAEAEAVRLFVDRARLVDPAFALTDANAGAIVEIGRRLDGIPLAIELAAARVKVFSVEEIRARLDDRFRLLTGGSRSAVPRQQTLLAAIRWSDDQLPAGERALLHALAVFVGAFDLERASRVAGGEEDAFATLDRLALLVDKSLLQVEREGMETRYRLLESVREFGLDRLREAGRHEEVARRHADLFHERAERAYAERFTREEPWCEALEADYDDLAAALEFHAARDPERRLEMAGALAWFWQARSHLRDGRQQIGGALAATAAAPARPARARALRGLGNTLAWQGESGAARAAMEEALEQGRALGDRHEIALALEGLGWIGVMNNENEMARAAFEESARLHGELGDPVDVHRARVGLGQALVALARVDEARSVAREIVAFAAPRGDRRNEHLGWHYLADCELIEGRHEASLALYRKSLLLAQAIGDRMEMSFEVQGVAMSLAGLGRTEGALRLAAAAAAEWRRIGADPHVTFWDALLERHLGAAAGALGEEAAARARAEGSATPFARAIEQALTGP